VPVDGIKTRVESGCGVCNQRLKVQHDAPPSNFAYVFNLRRYSEAVEILVSLKKLGGEVSAEEQGFLRAHITSGLAAFEAVEGEV